MPTEQDTTSRRNQLSAAKRALLEQRLRGKSSKQSGPAAPAITPRGASAPAQASFAQERLWYLHQLEPDSAAYNIHMTLRLVGPLDVDALHSALHRVIARHEILRTTFAEEAGRIVQTIAPQLRIDLPVHSETELPDATGLDARLAHAQEWAVAQIRTPFALHTGPLIRVALLEVGDADHLLVLVMHHIIADEWSLGVFWREIAEAYTAGIMGRAADFSPLPIQYADYAAWQRVQWASDAWSGQLAHWQAQLVGELPPLQLPVERPSVAPRTAAGALASLTLSPELSRDLRALSRAHEATVVMTLLAAFNVLLHRYTGATDIIIGMPIANRSHAETTGLIGLFLNTLVLRCHSPRMRPSVRS